MKYRVRFNKTRGNPGRGSREHVWRIFDETGKEYLCKHVLMRGKIISEKEKDSEDWNFVTYGRMEIDREKSIITLITE